MTNFRGLVEEKKIVFQEGRGNQGGEKFHREAELSFNFSSSDDDYIVLIHG